MSEAIDSYDLLGTRTDGDWVGYYYSTTTTIIMNGEDTTRASIGVLRFHNVGGEIWKLYQQMSSAAAYEEDDWSNPKDKLDSILLSRTNIKVLPESYV